MVRRKDTAAREMRDEEPTETRARRLERASATIRSALWILDARGSTLAVTDPVATILGSSPSEIIGGGAHRFWSRIHDRDRDLVADAFVAMFEGSRPCEVDFRMQHCDGSWVHLSARPVGVHAHGETLYVELVVTDVTAQRRAEIRRRTSEQRARALAAGNPTVAMVRRRGGSYAPTYVTTNVTALLGHPSRDLVTASTFWTRIVHADDRARAESSVRGALEAGSSTCEYRVLHADGEYRWIRDDTRRLPVDVDASLEESDGAELVSFWTDLTDRKRWEQACQTLEATVSLLAGRSEDAILLTSNGCVTYANDAFASSCGVDRAEDLRGLEVLGMVDARDRGAFASFLGDGKDCVALAAPVTLRWMKPKGGTVTLQCSALPSSVDGRAALLLFGAPA